MGFVTPPLSLLLGVVLFCTGLLLGMADNSPFLFLLLLQPVDYYDAIVFGQTKRSSEAGGCEFAMLELRFRLACSFSVSPPKVSRSRRGKTHRE